MKREKRSQWKKYLTACCHGFTFLSSIIFATCHLDYKFAFFFHKSGKDKSGLPRSNFYNQFSAFSCFLKHCLICFIQITKWKNKIILLPKDIQVFPIVFEEFPKNSLNRIYKASEVFPIIMFQEHVPVSPTDVYFSGLLTLNTNLTLFHSIQ